MIYNNEVKTMSNLLTVKWQYSSTFCPLPYISNNTPTNFNFMMTHDILAVCILQLIIPFWYLY